VINLRKLNPNAIAAFYEIEQGKLLLDFQKFRLFTQHPGSIGTFRERRLRQYLREVTPSRLSVGTGFVSHWIPKSGNIVDAQSRQIDCLIHDETQNAPYLRTEDYAIIRPEALFASIEVKSRLTFYRQRAPNDDVSTEFPLKGTDGRRYRWSGTMVEALENIKSIVDTCGASQYATFSAVFSYELDFQLETLYQALDNAELQTQIGIKHVDELPAIVCVPGVAVVVLSGRDMFESAPHHDQYTSFFNVMESTEKSAGYPLQFFTTYYYLESAEFSVTS